MSAWVRSISFLLMLAPATAAFQPIPDAVASVDKPDTLVLGKVSNNPRKHYRYLKPMAEYVAERMRDLGISKTQILMARDNRQMVRYLREGRVDWVTESAFPSVVFEELAGAKIVLRKWKKGVPKYRTVFFTRTDSGIERLEDLAGRTIALEDPGSTTAFLMPSVLMLRRGLPIVRLRGLNDTPPPDSVGFVFSRNEINSSIWVFKKLVDAGAFSNLDWEKPDHMPTKFRGDLKIIHESKSIPRAFETVRAGLDPVIVQRLKDVLLASAEDTAATMVLQAYQRTTRFDEIDDSIQAGLDDIRAAWRYLTRELE